MMLKDGPIIIIEDDKDDQYLMGEILREIDCGNEVIFFEDADAALEYINREDVHPFLVLSDINMPRMNGLDLRQMIFTNDLLSEKCIPYLFFTTGADKKMVTRAYSMSVQGFFQKPSSHEKLEGMVRSIISYWKYCIAPNEYN
jgi:CheY-like chemotaxis protein